MDNGGGKIANDPAEVTMDTSWLLERGSLSGDADKRRGRSIKRRARRLTLSPSVGNKTFMSGVDFSNPEAFPALPPSDEALREPLGSIEVTGISGVGVADIHSLSSPEGKHARRQDAITPDAHAVARLLTPEPELSASPLKDVGVTKANEGPSPLKKKSVSTMPNGVENMDSSAHPVRGEVTSRSDNIENVAPPETCDTDVSWTATMIPDSSVSGENADDLRASDGREEATTASFLPPVVSKAKKSRGSRRRSIVMPSEAQPFMDSEVGGADEAARPGMAHCTVRETRPKTEASSMSGDSRKAKRDEGADPGHHAADTDFPLASVNATSCLSRSLAARRGWRADTKDATKALVRAYYEAPDSSQSARRIAARLFCLTGFCLLPQTPDDARILCASAGDSLEWDLYNAEEPRLVSKPHHRQTREQKRELVMRIKPLFALMEEATKEEKLAVERATGIVSRKGTSDRYCYEDLATGRAVDPTEYKSKYAEYVQAISTQKCVVSALNDSCSPALKSAPCAMVPDVKLAAAEEVSQESSPVNSTEVSSRIPEGRRSVEGEAKGSSPHSRAPSGSTERTSASCKMPLKNCETSLPVSPCLVEPRRLLPQQADAGLLRHEERCDQAESAAERTSPRSEEAASTGGKGGASKEAREVKNITFRSGEELPGSEALPAENDEATTRLQVGVDVVMDAEKQVEMERGGSTRTSPYGTITELPTMDAAQTPSSVCETGGHGLTSTILSVVPSPPAGRHLFDDRGRRQSPQPLESISPRNDASRVRTLEARTSAQTPISEDKHALVVVPDRASPNTLQGSQGRRRRSPREDSIVASSELNDALQPPSSLLSIETPCVSTLADKNACTTFRSPIVTPPVSFPVGRDTPEVTGLRQPSPECEAALPKCMLADCNHPAASDSSRWKPHLNDPSAAALRTPDNGSQRTSSEKEVELAALEERLWAKWDAALAEYRVDVAQVVAKYRCSAPPCEAASVDRLLGSPASSQCLHDPALHYDEATGIRRDGFDDRGDASTTDCSGPGRKGTSVAIGAKSPMGTDCEFGGRQKAASPLAVCVAATLLEDGSTAQSSPLSPLVYLRSSLEEDKRWTTNSVSREPKPYSDVGRGKNRRKTRRRTLVHAFPPFDDDIASSMTDQPREDGQLPPGGDERDDGQGDKEIVVMCGLCLTKECDVTLRPCEHMACDACTDKLRTKAEHVGEVLLCPWDRRPIFEVGSIHNSNQAVV